MGGRPSELGFDSSAPTTTGWPDLDKVLGQVSHDTFPGKEGPGGGWSAWARREGGRADPRSPHLLLHVGLSVGDPPQLLLLEDFDGSPAQRL